MRHLSRRALLRASVSVAAVAAIAGCAGQTTAQLQADAQALVSGAKGFLAALQAVPGVTLPASVTGPIQTALTTIENNAASVATALTPSSLATGIEDAAETIGTLVAPFYPTAAALPAVVDALVSLAQLVVADVGGSSTTASATAPRYVVRQRYSRAQALAILKVQA